MEKEWIEIITSRQTYIQEGVANTKNNINAKLLHLHFFLQPLIAAN